MASHGEIMHVTQIIIQPGEGCAPFKKSYIFFIKQSHLYSINFLFLFVKNTSAESTVEGLLLTDIAQEVLV